MASAPEEGGRTQSTIQFPYTSIQDAIEVAEGLLKGGGVPLSRDQLAAAMNQAPGSGSFNAKLGTARAFAVMESVAGKYQLTQLGYEIADPLRQQDAMVRAFLSVELYKRTYDEFRGKMLPPRPHGLEAAFVSFGVSPKQKERARQAFDKSARAAGFFPNGDENRLVMPFGTGIQSPADQADGADHAGQAPPQAPPAPPPVAAQQERSQKALEYQLIDLLSRDGIGEAESDAIWTLVRFLKKKPADPMSLLE